MTIAPTPPKRTVERKIAALLTLVIFVLVSVVVGVKEFSASPPPPPLAAGYKCAPGSQFPMLKPGTSATVTTTDGTFTASFHATRPASQPVNDVTVGMPFRGTLTVADATQRWTLTGPINTEYSTINIMCVISFQGERDPAVMIEGFTGGAHCCEVPVIYLFNRSEGRYVKTVDMSPNHYKDPHAFNENEGFFPELVGHRVLLVTSDGAFAYAFGCYACSATPLVLDTVGPHGLTDVTGQHRALVAADARSIWKSAQQALAAESNPAHTLPVPFGLLSAWVADECTLGRGATAWATLLKLTSEGKLSNATYYRQTLDSGSYVTNLRAFLLSHDSCTGQI